MPVHDWSRVEAGIFHHFHHSWIEEIQRALNNGLLPEDYYAMAEQRAVGLGPDVLTLQTEADGEAGAGAQARPRAGGAGVLLAPPIVRFTAESDLEYYRRKQSTVVVRHISGDRIVAMIEVISPGNKASRAALRSLVEKVAELLDRRIHLLLLDLQPPGRRDPHGIHRVVWEEITDQEYSAPADKPLTLAAYESALTVRAYIEPVAVGDVLTDMPLFLQPGAYVAVPLEATYRGAWAAFPRRWQTFFEAPAGSE